MRTRYLKPGFFENEELAALPAATRLLFAGLWLIADKKGRLRDRPARIKGELFPYDATNVDQGLKRLAEFSFIRRYEVDGQKLIWIPTFLQHQRPHPHEIESVLPPHPDDRDTQEEVTEDSQSNDVAVTKSLPDPPRGSGTGTGTRTGTRTRTRARDRDRAPAAQPAEPAPEAPRGEEIARDWAEVQAAYEANIGPLLPADQQRLGAYCRQLPKDWVIAAIVETRGARDPGWPYLDKILRRCVNTSKPPSASKKAPAPGSARAAILTRYQTQLEAAAGR